MAERRKDKPYNTELLAKVYYRLLNNSTPNDRVRLLNASNINETILDEAIDIVCKDLKATVKADFKSKLQ